MNIEKTKVFYKKTNTSDLCDCEYCKNYIKEIKLEYPAISVFLNNIGVDIEKPFETMPLDPDKKGYIDYIGAQYIVFGESNNFLESKIDSVNISLTKIHPPTGIKDVHFVIEIYPIRLKWNM